MDADGYVWQIDIIAAGPSSIVHPESGRNVWVAPEAIQAAIAAGVFEGADSYRNHPTPDEERSRPERDVDDKIARVSAARWDPAMVNPIDGIAHGGAVGTWTTWDEGKRAALVAAHKNGIASPFDFSIYGPGETEHRVVAGKPWEYLTRLVSASVDLVTHGAAGGRFRSRLAASVRAAQEPTAMKPLTWAKFMASSANLAAAIVASASDDAAAALINDLQFTWTDDNERVAFLSDMRAARTASKPAAPACVPPPVAASTVTPPAPVIAASQCPGCAATVPDGAAFCPGCGAKIEAALPAAVAAAVASMNAATATALAAANALFESQREAFIASNLADMQPADVELLTPRLRASASIADMAGIVAAHRTYLGKQVTSGGFPVGTLRGASGVTVGTDEVDLYGMGVEGFIRGRDMKDSNGRSIERFSTLAAAIQNHPKYRHTPLTLTPRTIGHYMGGQLVASKLDVGVHGDVARETGPYVMRAGRLVPIRAAITTSDFGEIYADRMWKVFIETLMSVSKWETWMALMSDQPYWGDFKTHRHLILGEYANLEAIAEGSVYPLAVTPGDTEETGTLSGSKRGIIESYTLEAFMDPDGEKLRKFGPLLAQAMGRTILESVIDTLTTTNGTMAQDSISLYHSSSRTGCVNSLTNALSVSGLAASRTASRKFTARGSGKKLGAENDPAYLIVPLDLLDLAERVANPPSTYMQQSNDDADQGYDLHMFRGKIKGILPGTHLSDTNKWYTVADPAKTPTALFARLQGVPQPEMFYRTDPTAAGQWDTDTGGIKVRFWWATVPLEPRSFVENNPS